MTMLSRELGFCLVKGGVDKSIKEVLTSQSLIGLIWTKWLGRLWKKGIEDGGFVKPIKVALGFSGDYPCF